MSPPSSPGTSQVCQWCHLAGDWASPLTASAPPQVNVGILVAVTRVISQISSDNYKLHGDPSAFRYVVGAISGVGHTGHVPPVARSCQRGWPPGPPASRREMCASRDYDQALTCSASSRPWLLPT